MSMTRIKDDAYILNWLNSEKQLSLKGEPGTIRTSLVGMPDDLSGPGHIFEGFPIVGIQFLDANGDGSVLSFAPDEEKKGCEFIWNGIHFVWVRQDALQILELVPHDYRLASLEVLSPRWPNW